jgi:glycerol-3-phosphate cytidylyltransferase
MIVYTGGTFDLFHSGHVNFLSRISDLGAVTVSLNTDEFILEYKGSLPICSYDERKLVLENSIYVTNVVPNIGGADSKPSIEEVNPNIIAIGTDWASKDYYKQMQFTQDWLDEKNIMLLYVPYTKGISSTEIKKRL